MRGLDPRIHAFLKARQDVDGRVKPGHDDGEASRMTPELESAPSTTPGVIVYSSPLAAALAPVSSAKAGPSPAIRTSSVRSFFCVPVSWA